MKKNNLEETDKPIVHTHGLSMRNPTTFRKVISVEEGIDKIQGVVDVIEYDEFIEINTFSDNDLF